MYSKIKNKLRHHFHEVMKIKTSPHSIALGFSIGTFISVIPIPGFHILLALLVVLISEKINKVSLFVALAVWNPLTAPPIYFFSYKIGNLIFEAAPILDYDPSLLDKLFLLSRNFLVGNIIFASCVSIASYFLVRTAIWIYKRWKKKSSPH